MRVPRPEHAGDLLVVVEEEHARRRPGLDEIPEHHAGQIARRLHDPVPFHGCFTLPEPADLQLLEQMSSLYQTDPGRRPVVWTSDDETPRGRAITIGLQRLRAEARAALLGYQAMCCSGDLAGPDFAWLLRVTAARAFLVESRALATLGLLPQPEWADQVCPVHGVRHDH